MKNLASSYKFGNWEIQADLGIITNSQGKELILEPRLNKLFCQLLQHKNEIVRRQELIENIWDEVVVNEESLTKAVFDLRSFFKKHKLEEVEIKTIRKIGYRITIREKEKTIVPIGSRYFQPKFFIKLALYFIIACLFLIMFIRAINY